MEERNNAVDAIKKELDGLRNEVDGLKSENERRSKIIGRLRRKVQIIELQIEPEYLKKALNDIVVDIMRLHNKEYDYLRTKKFIEKEKEELR